MLINSSQMRLPNPSTVPSVSSSPLTPTGEGKNLNSELWHACAGPLVSLPAVGSRVVYLPQGHSEQVAASTQKGADGHHIPSYPSLPAHLVCHLHEIILHADKETDEVYCQMTLQPLAGESYCVPDLGSPSRQPSILFCKTLTASDTSTHGGFSVPKRAAEKVFPPLDYSQQPPAQELIARDLHDIEWKFRHIYRGQPKRHLLTTGWSVFVSAKRLVAGDSVLFIRNEKGQLLVGIRRPTRPQAVMPSFVLSSDSMHIGVLAAAAHAAKTNSRFTVFYNPRASPSPFVISLARFERSIHTRVSIGMRFRMLFETEESSVRRFMGFITGISDLDPVRWPNSHWRSIKVGWDESTAGDRQRRVSLWEIEPLTTFLVYPPTSDWRSAKDPWPQPIIGTAFLGDIGGVESLKRSSAWMDFQSGGISSGYTSVDTRGGVGTPALLSASSTRPGIADYYLGTGGGGSAAVPTLTEPLMPSDFQQQQQPPKSKSLCFDPMMMMAATPTSAAPYRAPTTTNNNAQILPCLPQQQQQMQSQISEVQQKHEHHHQLQQLQHLQPQPVQAEAQVQSQGQAMTQGQQLAPQSLQQQQQSFPQSQTLQIPHPEPPLPPPQTAHLHPQQQSLHSSADPPLQSPAHQSAAQQPHQSKQIHLHQQQRLSQPCSASSPLLPPQRNGINQSLLLMHRSFPSEQHESTIEQQYSDTGKLRQSGSGPFKAEPQVQQSSLTNSLTRLPSFKSQASQSSIVSTPESTLCESSVVSSCSVASNTLQSVLGSMAADTESFHVVNNPAAAVMHASVVMPSELHQESILQLPSTWPSISAANFSLMSDIMDTRTRSVSASVCSQAIDQQQAMVLIPSQAPQMNNSSPFQQQQEQANQFQKYGGTISGAACGSNISGAGVELDPMVMMATSDPASYGDSYEFCREEYESHSLMMMGGSGAGKAAMVSDMDLCLSEGFSSGDLDDPSFLQAFAQATTAPVRTYTKVYKTGSVGRSLDVTRFSNYGELRAELARLFGLQTQLLEDPNSVIFVDRENDLLLLGDDPWETFVNNVRSITILSPAEVLQMQNGAALPPASAFCPNGPNQQQQQNVNPYNTVSATASAYSLDY